MKLKKYNYVREILHSEEFSRRCQLWKVGERERRGMEGGRGWKGGRVGERERTGGRERGRKGERERNTDRQTERQADKMMHRDEDGQTGREKETEGGRERIILIDRRKGRGRENDAQRQKQTDRKR